MLPRYRKLYNDQDPLLSTHEERASVDEGRISTETAPPLYPPGSSAVPEGRHNVEYSYGPKYPRVGEIEHVVGVLGTTKQETIEIVQRGIKGLAHIDPDRLSFKIHQGSDGAAHWASVMDEAWERFDADPPKRLAVVVADLPGEEDLRKRREQRQEWLGGFQVLMIVLGCILSGVVGYFLLTASEKAKKVE